MKRVNFRRGLFRVWIILSCLWAIMVCALFFGDVRGEFAKAAARTPQKVARAQPNPAPQADHRTAYYKGVEYTFPPDVTNEEIQKHFGEKDPTKIAISPAPSPVAQAHNPGDWRDDPKTLPLCDPDKFGRIPMDCVPYADNAAYDAAVAAAHPWRMVLETLALAVAPPIGVFILGLSCLWAIAGFTRTESEAQ